MAGGRTLVVADRLVRYPFVFSLRKVRQPSNSRKFYVDRTLAPCSDARCRNKLDRHFRLLPPMGHMVHFPIESLYGIDWTAQRVVVNGMKFENCSFIGHRTMISSIWFDSSNESEPCRFLLIYREVSFWDSLNWQEHVHRSLLWTLPQFYLRFRSGNLVHK